MKKNCLKCGGEYELNHFSFDNGYCKACEPGFWSFAETRLSTPAETKSLFVSMIGLNIFFLFILGMLLDGGAISDPGVFFFSGMTVYCVLQVVTVHRSPSGYPCLTVWQRWGLILMPFYGFPIFFIIWRSIRTYLFHE